MCIFESPCICKWRKDAVHRLQWIGYSKGVYKWNFQVPKESLWHWTRTSIWSSVSEDEWRHTAFRICNPRWSVVGTKTDEWKCGWVFQKNVKVFYKQFSIQNDWHGNKTCDIKRKAISGVGFTCIRSSIRHNTTTLASTLACLFEKEVKDPSTCCRLLDLRTACVRLNQIRTVNVDSVTHWKSWIRRFNVNTNKYLHIFRIAHYLLMRAERRSS